MAKERKSKLSAIMVTDIVGYSRVMENDERTALYILDTHNQILFPLIEQFDGKIVKTIGDALLIDFSSALSAANCAVNIQKALADYNQQAENNRRIYIRIGIHIGDVWYTENDILGDGVNIAAGLEQFSLPGGICISKEMYDILSNKIDLKVTHLGLKNAIKSSKTIDMYRIHTGTEEDVKDDRNEKILLKNTLFSMTGEHAKDTGIDRDKDGLGTSGYSSQQQADTDPLEKDPAVIIKKKIFSTIEKFMDRAVMEWDKVPQKKKDMVLSKMKKAPWFHEWEWDHVKRHGMRHRGKQRNLQKKGGEEFAVGIAATIGFGAAFIITNLWFLIFPLIFVGLVPLLMGISRLFRRRRISGTEKEQGNKVDKEKEILKLARELHGRLTVLQVASQTNLSIEDARTTLDAMVKNGYVQLNVLETGILQYEIPEFFTEPEKDDVTKQIDELDK